MYTIKQASRKLQNYVSANTELENLVRELTNTDPWGPSSQQLYELNRLILNSINPESYKITSPPLRVDDFPNPEYISDSSKIVFHLFNRIHQYSSINTRYLSFPKTRSFLNGEKSPMFQNYSSNTIYDRLKKNYINQGVEHWIISRSLTVLEYLLINCFTNDYDIKDEISCYIQYLEQIKNGYVCEQAQDHKMKFHTESIRSKCDQLIQLLTDPDELAPKRKVIHNVSNKINQHSISSQMHLKSLPNGTRARGSSLSNWAKHSLDHKSGLKLNDEDYQDHSGVLDISYNDQDLTAYYKGGDDEFDSHSNSINNNSSEYLDEIEDGNDFGEFKTQSNVVVKEEDSYDEYPKDDIAYFQEKTNKNTNLKDKMTLKTISKQMESEIPQNLDLLDLNDADEEISTSMKYIPLSPSSLNKAKFEPISPPATATPNKPKLTTKSEYILDTGNFIINNNNVPKSSPTTTIHPANDGKSGVGSNTKTKTDRSSSLFDDLFQMGKENQHFKS